MKRNVLNFQHLYQKALLTYLEQGMRAGIDSAKGLGIQSLAAGFPILDLAKLHERSLIMDILPNFPAPQWPALIKQAGTFFAAAIAPISKSDFNAKEALRVKKIIETLSDRTVELAASNLQLSAEISHRRKAEESLKKSGLPNLWIPDKEMFFHVESFGLLGTGKLDLAGIKRTAIQLTGIRGDGK